MINPLISVIIPTYNRAHYVCEAINSVLAQTYKNIEIIVVDDGSTDNTGDIIQRYISKAKYIFQNNAGPSVARNNGIRQSRGKLIAFLDSDDIWLPDKLETQMELMRQSQYIGLVSCGMYIIDVSGKVISDSIIKENHKNRKSFIKELLVHNTIIGGGSSTLIKKECFDKLGVFNEDIWIGEDWDMWIRIAKHYDIRIVEKPLIKCRIHETNLSNNAIRIETDIKKVIARNIEKSHFILRMKAYSYAYRTIAMAYMTTQNRDMALVNIIKSIIMYPMKNYNESSKYKFLIKCMLPPKLLDFVRKVSK